MTAARLPERLASYLPRCLLTRLAGEATAPSSPSEERFQAALMAADVSGFTRLSELLAAKGPAGAEELSGALNQYFAKLVDIIEQHGGDILRFAGDAPLVLFRAHDGNLAAAAGRATQCGLSLQATLHDYETSAGPRLSMRVWVTAGDIASMVVGGVDGRWELVVGGQPFKDLERFASLGKPGEVLVSHAVWGLLGGAVEGDVIDASTRRVRRLRSVHAPASLGPPPVDRLSAAAMSAFVPRTVLYCLEMLDSEWLAESRRVTVAFASLEGVDVAESGSLLALNDAFRAVQTAIYHYEGSVNQFLFDDKGLVVLALWGIPSRTHEDDPARAIEAMLAAEAALRDRGLGCAIGITTERVFCGHRGSASRREYAVIGQSVNLAARLMGTASQRA